MVAPRRSPTAPALSLILLALISILAACGPTSDDPDGTSITVSKDDGGGDGGGDDCVPKGPQGNNCK